MSTRALQSLLSFYEALTAKHLIATPPLPRQQHLHNWIYELGVQGMQDRTSVTLKRDDISSIVSSPENR